MTYNRATTKINSKLSAMENHIKITPQANKRNQNKSKFTVLKGPKLSKEPSLTGSLEAKHKGIAKRENRKPEIIKKFGLPVTPVTKTMPPNRTTGPTEVPPSLNKRIIAKRTNPSPAKEKPKPDLIVTSAANSTETGVQTNEGEILNHLLIVGDLKIMKPSKSVVDNIEKMRKEMNTKNLLMATRKFEEHSQNDERHLDDLKEFFDKSYITRKPPRHRYRNRDMTFDDRKIIESMDELLQRERPKTESITDIKSRIKQKEQELLSLFDNFQKKTEDFGKTNI